MELSLVRNDESSASITPSVVFSWWDTQDLIDGKVKISQTVTVYRDFPMSTYHSVM